MKRFSSQPEIPPDFSGRIKRLREQYRLTQAQLAGLWGVSPPSINRWESGQAQPSGAIWQQIRHAEELGLKVLGNDGTRPAQGSVHLLRDARVGYHVAPAKAVSVDVAADPEVVRVSMAGSAPADGVVARVNKALQAASPDLKLY